MQTVHVDIWKEYRETKSPELRSKIFHVYLRLVKFIAARFVDGANRRESVIQRDDLLQVGMMGLLEAIDRFDPDRGFKFETYAISRIQGAIQDELRRIDWLPRSERKKLRDAEKEATENDDRSFQFRISASDVSLTREAILYLNDTGDDELIRPIDLQIADTTPDVTEQMNNNDVVGFIVGRLEDMPERDRLVVTLYYYEEMKFKEIGEVLGITESRVSQIHSAVISKLRKSVETSAILL